MNTNLIIISEYCLKSETDPTFLFSLEESGLIEIQTINGEQYLHTSQLGELEKYSHLHYDLAINIEGIDAIRHILSRMEQLKQEITHLRRTLTFYQNSKEALFRKDSDLQSLA